MAKSIFINNSNEIAIYQGDSYDNLIHFLDESNNPVDITGKQFRIQIRKKVGGELVLDLSVASGYVTMDYTSSPMTARIQIPRDVTADLPIGSWVHDRELSDATGYTETLVEANKAVVKGQVTKDE